VTDDALSDLTLAEILAAAAEELDGLTVDSADLATTWSAGGHLFATLTGNRAEFHLDPLVARAALRTPDTLPSARGADWVAFAPAAIDDPAIDRAEAWFLSAYRRATAVRR
jgi:acyl dehydratase